MRQAIVIGSTTRTKDWLQNCLNSFGDYKNYPIIVVVNNDFELGKIKWVMDNTNLDEFFLLHDTVEIKSLSMFDIAFQTTGSFALSNQPVYMGMFLGKYRREILSQMQITPSQTKIDAVLAEVSFNNRYAQLEPNQNTISSPLVNTDVFEEKFGRKNMVLENPFIKKYKGTWSMEMVKNI